jgi:hypothetical protein
VFGQCDISAAVGFRDDEGFPAVADSLLMFFLLWCLQFCSSHFTENLDRFFGSRFS